MDALILVVVAGCALAGGVWGVIRLGAWIVALVVALAGGRWAGPPVASLLAGGDTPSPWLSAAGVALAAASAAGLVLLAGHGLRQGAAKAHLGCVDRLAGALAAGGVALALTAVLLALAGESGYHPASTWAQRLQQAGRGILVLPNRRAVEAPGDRRADYWSRSNPAPNAMPSNATKNGQQPQNVGPSW